MKHVPLVCLLLACGPTGPREPDRTVALRMQGNVYVAGDTTTLAGGTGNVSFFIYRDSSEGFCLRTPSSLVTVARNIIRGYTADDLLTGQPYAFEMLQPEGLEYPFDIYPVAVFQRAFSPDNVCEGDPAIYNGRGANVAADSATSACCGLIPAPIRVEGPDTELVVDFNVVSDAPRALAACSPNDVGFDRCALRRAPDGSDSACALALGEDAGALLRAADGTPCP
jgi:hypothetical protein